MNHILSILFISFALFSCSKSTHDLSEYGLNPNTGADSSPLFKNAIEELQQKIDTHKITLIKLAPGRYDFYPDNAAVREYYISNHDQDNPKQVGIPFENMKNIIFDGQGAELIFHGRMLPISLLHSENVTLKNFHIDFENPHISQVEILENDTAAGIITFKVAPWVKYEIRDSAFTAFGEGWEHIPKYGIAFEELTKRVVYQTGDIQLGTERVIELSPHIIKSLDWKDARLIPNTIIAMRGPGRPTPGIFVSNSTNINLNEIKVHYAEGMGLLAQGSENIALDGFSVCLRGKADPRYFTTQADATHFSGCKGVIISQNGLYESMMDDAINVHGTYLKVSKRINDTVLEAQYMHPQSYGFEWGSKGDIVQFLNSKTMEVIGSENSISDIQAVDKPSYHGAKIFRITFEQPIPASIDALTFGIENLEWTPEIIFSNNIIRNNRARGSLFSSPKATIIENNLFDHTSGAAILLSGDCNGWFESGACHNIMIRKNTFRQALTSMYQFTDAVISIYPVIPDLGHQKQYFHKHVLIENNLFEYFDKPLLYAKSVDSLIFRSNQLRPLTPYPPFHRNEYRIYLEHVNNFVRTGNAWGGGFNAKTDIYIK